MTRRRPPSPPERRSGVDRRKKDVGPPVGRDRRVSIEPRKPDVQEIEMTPSEWASLAGHASPPPAPAPRDEAAPDAGKTPGRGRV